MEGWAEVNRMAKTLRWVAFINFAAKLTQEDLESFKIRKFILWKKLSPKFLTSERK